MGRVSACDGGAFARASFASFLSRNAQDSVLPSVNGVAADAASVSHRRASAFAARLRHAGRLVGLELGAAGPDVDHAAARSGQHGRAYRGAVRDDHRGARLAAHRGGAAALRQDDDAHRAARLLAERHAAHLHPRLGRDLRLPGPDEDRRRRSCSPTSSRRTCPCTSGVPRRSVSSRRCGGATRSASTLHADSCDEALAQLVGELGVDQRRSRAREPAHGHAHLRDDAAAATRAASSPCIGSFRAAVPSQHCRSSARRARRLARARRVSRDRSAPLAACRAPIARGSREELDAPRPGI